MAQRAHAISRELADSLLAAAQAEQRLTPDDQAAAALAAALELLRRAGGSEGAAAVVLTTAALEIRTRPEILAALEDAVTDLRDAMAEAALRLATPGASGPN